MNRNKLAQMQYKKVRVRPVSKRFDERGRELEQLDDLWMIMEASKAVITLHNIRTEHRVPIGTDHVREYLSDASKLSDGILVLKSEILLEGKSVSVEPIIHATSRFVPQELDEALRIASGIVIQGPSPLSCSKSAGGASIWVSSFSAWIRDLDAVLSFNSGSISGLANDTTYYVYAGDAERRGGLVTYLATVIRSNALSGRDKIYIGRIRTPLGARVSRSQSDH
jgi:hypothetical protein